VTEFENAVHKLHTTDRSLHKQCVGHDRPHSSLLEEYVAPYQGRNALASCPSRRT